MDLKGRGEQSTMKRYLAYVLLITIIFISSCGSSNSSATESEEDVISIDETVSEEKEESGEANENVGETTVDSDIEVDSSNETNNSGSSDLKPWYIAPIAKSTSEEDRRDSEITVERSTVLLKNVREDRKAVLPIKSGMNVYVLGPAADDEEVQCGGVNQGWDNVKKTINGIEVTTILDGLKEVGASKEINVLTDPASASEADMVLLFIGEQPYTKWASDYDDLSITGCHALEENQDAIEEARLLRDEYGIPTVACIVSGRHVLIDDYIDKWDAVVMCYLPGSEGRGVANLLMGVSGFYGSLKKPWYKSTNGTEECLFPEGYGRETEGEGRYNKGDEIPVIINGVNIHFEEMTLEEMMDATGLTSDCEIESGNNEIDQDSPIAIQLKTNDSEQRLWALVKNKEYHNSQEIRNAIVCGISFNCFNKRHTELLHGEESVSEIVEWISVGGVRVGDDSLVAYHTFGDPLNEGPFFDGFRHFRNYVIDNNELSISSTKGTIDFIRINKSAEINHSSEVQGEYSLETDDLRKEIQDIRKSNYIEWDESDNTQSVSYNGLSLIIPEKWNVNEKWGDLLISESEDASFARFIVSCMQYRFDEESDGTNRPDEYSNEEEAYSRLKYELENSDYIIDVEYEEGYFKGFPALYFYKRFNKEDENIYGDFDFSDADGNTFDVAGVVFETNNYRYKCQYIFNTDNDYKQTGEKIINSISVNTDHWDSDN